MEIKIHKGKKKTPLRIGIFGQGATGKSTFAKDALVADIEGGLNEIDCESVDLVGTGAKGLSEFLKYVIKHHKDIKQDTIAIDSIDWVEKQIHADICAEREVKSGSINDAVLAYGVGHQMAKARFVKLFNTLDMIRDLGFNILIIAHAKIQTLNDPNLNSYDRWDVSLEKNIRRYFREWLDILAYVNIETYTVKQESQGFGGAKFKPTTTGRRLLNIGNDPSYESKTRVALPDKIDLSWSALMSAIEESRAGKGDTAKQEPKKKEKENGRHIQL